MKRERFGWWRGREIEGEGYERAGRVRNAHIGRERGVSFVFNFNFNLLLMTG